MLELRPAHADVTFSFPLWGKAGMGATSADPLLMRGYFALAPTPTLPQWGRELNHFQRTHSMSTVRAPSPSIKTPSCTVACSCMLRCASEASDCEASVGTRQT